MQLKKSTLCHHSQSNCASNIFFKLHYETFPSESNIQTCEKATVGIHLSSEMAKTGLNVTANSNIRQITDVCG